MTLTYTTYVDQLANMMVIPTADTNFQTFLPGCIDYAEQRIYRDLDVLNSRVVSTAGSLQANTRTFSLPTDQGAFITVETMSAFLSSGPRQQMVCTTKDFINAVYPSETVATGSPLYFAPISNTLYMVGPAPDIIYPLEVIGTIRPAALSSANSSTFLTQYCPDLFMAGSMIFAMGYQRDWGSMSDDPKAAVSWEQQYGTLLVSAREEQLRARFEGAAWTPMAPSNQPRV